MHSKDLLTDSFSCDCDHDLTRRGFLKTVGTGAALTASGLLPAFAKQPSSQAQSETLAATLHKSLTEEQRKVVCFPFDHPLRSKVDNNWQITDKTVAEFFTKDQQAMIREIFVGLHSPEYAGRVLQQVEHDGDKEGFGGCAIALFGEPGSGKFEFVLSGRHVTRRCDGDSVEGTAFGGPIFYGHAPRTFNEGPQHEDNIYWYQARRANEVFQMLDGRQRAAALLDASRPEKGTETVKLTGRKTGLPGLAVGDMSHDQRELVHKVMADLLAPFRKPDADEAMKLVKANGFENLHMAFYKNQDIGNDGVWDVWQVEGPAMLWYFRGAPHVHVWVNIRRDATA